MAIGRLIAAVISGLLAASAGAQDMSRYGGDNDARAIRVTIGAMLPGAVSPLGDINADGFADLAFHSFIILGRPDGGEIGASSHDVVAVPPEWNAILVSPIGDVTGDGISDIDLLCCANNTYSEYIIHGEKNFAFPAYQKRETDRRVQAIPRASHFAYGDIYTIGLGDTNGDGIGDFLTSGRSGDAITYLLLNGKRTGDYSSEHEGSAGRLINPVIRPCTPGAGNGEVEYSSFFPGGDVFGMGVDFVLTGNPTALAPDAELPPGLESWPPCALSSQTFSLLGLGDISGDGKTDFAAESGERYEILSSLPPNSHAPHAYAAGGDVNGDGPADPIGYDGAGAVAYVGRPLGAKGGSVRIVNGSAVPIGDFNGDGYHDFFSRDGRIVLGNRERFSFASAGTYHSFAKAGAAPLRAVGEVPGGAIFPPDARAWIGFADGSGPSLQSVMLHRNLDSVENIPTDMIPAFVHWAMTTDRADSTSTTISLKYLDREIGGLDEDKLILLESSGSASGPWRIVDGAKFETDRNTVHFQTTKPGDYIIAERAAADVSIFTFNQSPEGWSYDAPLHPEIVSGGMDMAGGSLRIASGGLGVFAFLESPPAPIVNQAQSALYRLTYRVLSDQPDALLNPVVRFRVSTANFEQSQQLIVPSTDIISKRAAFSPSLTGTRYEQFILAPPNQSSLRMDFDVMTTDPDPPTTVTLSFDSARLEPVTLDAESSTIMYYDFRNVQKNGFTLSDPIPTLTPAGFDAGFTGDGLSLRASQRHAKSVLAFGYFGKTEGAARFKSGHLYRVDWTLASHATAEDSHSLPGFRLRVNSESFQFSSILHVEPKAAEQPLPIAGAPVTYLLYFKAPDAIDGERMIFSFDYLTTPDSGADSTQAIILQQMAVREY